MNHFDNPSPVPSHRDAVSIVDVAGVIHFISSGTPSAGLECPSSGSLGESMLTLVHPEDRARLAEALESFGKGMKSVVPLEYRLPHPDGSWRQFQATGEPLSVGVGPCRTVLIAREISERMTHLERLRLLESVATHANDAILITDALPIDVPGPHIIYANPAFLNTTGYTLEEVIGQSPRILQGPDTAREPREKIRRALKRWRPVVVELLNYRKNGTTFWVELSIVPVTDATGLYTHWVSIQRDISERKQAEESLRAARDEAETANRTKSDFLSRMSHELRTPLNGIMGFSQILQLDATAASHRAIADDLFEAGHRLLGLINEVLDISRVESGGMPLSVEPVSLTEVIRESLNLIAPMAAKRAVRTRIDIPADAMPFVLADRQRLGQVLLNLLSNAVKYNRDGGSLAVSVRHTGSDGYRVLVTDTGFGIPAGKVGRLFTPFDRLDAEATGVEGTGLGLALSKGLIEAMGGTIRAESEPGRGSTFWFELPACDIPTQLVDEPTPAEPQRLPTGSHTVLYIEDNIANFRLIELALAHRPGVRLMAAMQGGQGVELAALHRPDLILLDLHLPDLTGEEVFRRLRADPATRDIPVVVLSADATPGRAARLRSAGALDYLTKPLDIRQFLRVLDESLVARAERASR